LDSKVLNLKLCMLCKHNRKEHIRNHHKITTIPPQNHNKITTKSQYHHKFTTKSPQIHHKINKNHKESPKIHHSVYTVHESFGIHTGLTASRVQPRQMNRCVVRCVFQRSGLPVCLWQFADSYGYGLPWRGQTNIPLNLGKYLPVDLRWHPTTIESSSAQLWRAQHCLVSVHLNAEIHRIVQHRRTDSTCTRQLIRNYLRGENHHWNLVRMIFTCGISVVSNSSSSSSS